MNGKELQKTILLELVRNLYFLNPALTNLDTILRATVRFDRMYYNLHERNFFSHGDGPRHMLFFYTKSKLHDAEIEKLLLELLREEKLYLVVRPDMSVYFFPLAPATEIDEELKELVEAVAESFANQPLHTLF